MKKILIGKTMSTDDVEDAEVAVAVYKSGAPALLIGDSVLSCNIPELKLETGIVLAPEHAYLRSRLIHDDILLEDNGKCVRELLGDTEPMDILPEWFSCYVYELHPAVLTQLVDARVSDLEAKIPKGRIDQLVDDLKLKAAAQSTNPNNTEEQRRASKIIMDAADKIDAGSAEDLSEASDLIDASMNKVAELSLIKPAIACTNLNGSFSMDTMTAWTLKGTTPEEVMVSLRTYLRGSPSTKYLCKFLGLVARQSDDFDEGTIRILKSAKEDVMEAGARFDIALGQHSISSSQALRCRAIMTSTARAMAGMLTGILEMMHEGQVAMKDDAAYNMYLDTIRDVVEQVTKLAMASTVRGAFAPPVTGGKQEMRDGLGDAFNESLIEEGGVAGMMAGFCHQHVDSMDVSDEEAADLHRIVDSTRRTSEMFAELGMG